MIDEALAKKLKLQGITKAARHPMFQGKRRRDSERVNFTEHVCYLCGEWRPCEIEVCNHAVCVRVLACCDPKRQEQVAALKFGSERRGEPNERT